MKNIIAAGIILFSISCTNYYRYPSFSEHGNPFIVVENPAGTNEKYEYDQLQNKFDLEQVDGKSRIIRYISYPGNYGFIPSTMMAKDKGGDGDPLDVLAIGSTIKRGSILQFAPVGILKMMDNGEEDHKIIGVIIHSDVSVIACQTLECIKTNYPGMIEIIETWFSNYEGKKGIEILGWADEKAALEMIKEWQVDFD